MIDVEDWAEIRRLHRAEGMGDQGDRPPAGRGPQHGAGGAAVGRAAALSSGRRRARSVDAVEPEIRELLRRVPDDAGDGDRRADRLGRTGSRCCRSGWRELRPLFVPPDPCQRTDLSAGRAGPVGSVAARRRRSRSGHGQAAKLWVVVGVSGFSRLIGGWMVPSRAGPRRAGRPSRRCSASSGRCPGMWVWDQEGCIGRWRGGRAGASPTSSRRSGARSAIGVELCAPGDPEAKGLVERANGYLETSFLPGRRFDDVADFNAPAHRLAAPSEPADPRHHQGAGRRRRSSRTAGRCWPFPPVLPDPALRFSDPPARDHYVRVDTCDYSVNPRFDRPPGRRARRPSTRSSSPAPAPRSPATPAAWPRHQTITDARARPRARERCAPSTPSPTPSPTTPSRNATSPSMTGPSGWRDGHRTTPSPPPISPTCAGR